MSNWNKNSGYGRALLDAIKANIGTFGNVMVVMNSANSDETNYHHTQEVFTPDPDGLVRFYTTVNAAYDATESNNNDVIVIDNNSSHTLTSRLDVTNNRVHFVGLDYLMGMRKPQGQGAKINLAGSGATNTAVIRNTGVRNSFRGIKFESSNTR